MSLSKSRFIEMFDLYKEKKLSEVAEIIMGQSPDSNSYNNTEMGLPFYQGKTEFSDKYIGSPVTWCSSPCRIAEKNDILMSVRAPVGDVNIATEKCCIGRGLASIRPLDGESTFLFYALKLKKAEIASKGNGSTFKAINKETVHSITIPDVPQELKVKFSMFAEQIDKSKFLLQKILEKLELLKKSRFIEMFGDPIKNEKRWPQLTLDSVCDGIGDGLHGTPEYDDLGAFYFINGNNLINGTIVITPSTKKVNETTYKKYFTNISSNALLLSINGTLGKIAFYNDEAITLGKSACYINLKSFVNRYFVFELMRTDPFLKYLEENSTKSTIKNVSLKTIRNFKLISPPEILQNDFIAFSKQIDKSKLVIQKSLEDLVGKS